MEKAMGKNIKRRIFDIIQLGNVSDTPSRMFDFFLVAVIIVNTLLMFLETFDSLSKYRGAMEIAENLTVLVFVIEYALRIWTAEYLYPTQSRGKARLKYCLSFDGIVELMTILPFFFLSGAVAFRMLRVVRIFHLFRINSSYDSFNVITTVLREKWNQIASSLFIVFVLMLASSLCMYSVEHQAQPDKFTNALSGMWWSVSALLTVGYGDIYPITTLGKIMAVVISFLGVGAVAIPTGIISAGFVEQYSRVQGGDTVFNGRVFTVTVDIDSSWLGKSVKDIREAFDIRILMVARGGEEIEPEDTFRIELGDMLCVYAQRKNLR